MIEEDKELEEKEEDNQLLKILNQIYVIIIAVFLCLLLLSYSLPVRTVIEIISGKIISSTIENNTIIFKDKKIIFEESTYQSVRQIFLANQKAETMMCLVGEITGNEYYINSVYIPKIYTRDVYSVTAVACNNDTVISLHTHPIFKCLFSEQDMKSYEFLKKNNPNLILGLMCDERRFSLYSKRTK